MRKKIFVSTIICFVIGTTATFIGLRIREYGPKDEAVRTIMTYQEGISSGQYESIEPLISDDIDLQTLSEQSHLSKAEFLGRLKQNTLSIASMEAKYVSCEIHDSTATVRFVESLTVDSGGKLLQHLGTYTYSLTQSESRWVITSIQQNTD